MIEEVDKLETYFYSKASTQTPNLHPTKTFNHSSTMGARSEQLQLPEFHRSLTTLIPSPRNNKQKQRTLSQTYNTNYKYFHPNI